MTKQVENEVQAKKRGNGLFTRGKEENSAGFSWKSLTGISTAKARMSRQLGIPLTRSGRQKKFGAKMGCLVMAAPIVVVACLCVYLVAVWIF